MPKKILLFTMLIFLLWLPVYLAYYPGVFSYDILVQTKMILGLDPLTDQQPVAHTFFFMICMYLEKLTGIKCIVFYSLSQMLILAMGCASVVAYIDEHVCKKVSSKLFLLVVLLFYCFNPFISVLSFSTCKNILFGVWLLMFTHELILFVEKKPENSSITRYIPIYGYGLLGCLFLNNFIYVILVFTLVLIIFYRHRFAKLFFATFIMTIASYYLSALFIYPSFGVGKGDVKEMMSVPLQQLVYIRESGKITLDEEKVLLDFFEDGDYGYFQFGNADMIKTRFSASVYSENKQKFWSLYKTCLVKYPFESAYAFLRLNFPLWSPIGFDLCDYTMTGYIEMQSFEGPIAGFSGFERRPVLPELNDVFDKFTSYSLFRNNPLRQFLFGTSFPFWVIVVCMIRIMISRKPQGLVPFIPVMLLLGTYLLGPLSNMRYVFPYVILLPRLIYYSFCEN